MSRQIDSVIFDLDGTLVDSQPAVLRATKEALARFDVVVSDQEVKERFGGGSRNLMSHFLVKALGAEKAAEYIDAAVAAKNDLQTGYSTEVEALPGVRVLLNRLKRDGYRLAIATMAAGVVANTVLAHNRIDALFDQVLAVDDVTNPKPDPEILVLAARRLDVEQSRCLYVGDSFHDLEAAAAVGMPFVLADTGLYVDGTRRSDLISRARDLDYPVVPLDELESIASVVGRFPKTGVE